MRALKFAKINLFEMPYLTAGSVDFGLEDPTRNLRRAVLIQNTPHTIIRSDKFGILYRRKQPQGGDFAHIATDTN